MCGDEGVDGNDGVGVSGADGVGGGDGVDGVNYVDEVGDGVDGSVVEVVRQVKGASLLLPYLWCNNNDDSPHYSCVIITSLENRPLSLIACSSMILLDSMMLDSNISIPPAAYILTEQTFHSLSTSRLMAQW